MWETLAPMRSIGVEGRRARLGIRHHLGRRATDVVTVARALVGLHSSDPASVMLAARARTDDLVPADVERALYEERSLVRMLGMRRTMFVEPVGFVPLIHAACTRALAARERARTVEMIEQAGIARNGSRWLDGVCLETLVALEKRGEATASELGRDVPGFAERIRVGIGKRWEGEIGLSTRVLFLLATEGLIVRGRPKGSWISTQYRWAPLRSWVDVDPESMDTDEARSELARLWLAAFGPGTPKDLKWWAGWTVAQTKKALAAVQAVEVDLEGEPGLVLPDDLDDIAAPAPWVALVPALDPTVMGWAERGFYLGDHRTALFDRNGNAGPTIWADGRVVGGWAQRPNGAIAIRILEDVGREKREAIDAEAAALDVWLGPVRFIPRFRTPLERELYEG